MTADRDFLLTTELTCAVYAKSDVCAAPPKPQACHQERSCS